MNSPVWRNRTYKDCMDDARWHHEWSLKLNGHSACHHQRMSANLYAEARELREKSNEGNY